MAQPIGSAYAEIKLNQRGFNSQLGAMGTSFNRTGGKMMGMAKQISGSFLGMAGAAGAGIGAIKGVNAAVDKFVSFDTKLRNVWTLTDMTWEQMQKLGTEIQDVSARYGQLGEAGLDAMYQIYSAGFQGAEGMELFEQSLIGALAGMTTVKQQADVLAGTLNAYGWSVEKASYVNDVFFKIIEKGVTNASELGASFGKLTAIAAPLGVEFEELAGAIITLTKSGIGTAETMTSMRQSIIELSKPGESLIAVMKALGYETGQAMIASIGWAGSIAEITKYAIANNLELIDLFSSVEAIMAILPLATTQAEMFAQSQDEVADASGAAAAAAEKQRGEQLKLDKATSELDAAMVRLGASIGTVVDWKVAIKGFLAFLIEDFTTLIERAETFAYKLADLPNLLANVFDSEYMERFRTTFGTPEDIERWRSEFDQPEGDSPAEDRGRWVSGDRRPLEDYTVPGGTVLTPEIIADRVAGGFQSAWDTTFGTLSGLDLTGGRMPLPTASQYGPLVGTEPDVPEAVLGPWTDAFDELAEALSADPTGGVNAIQSFLASYGEIPAALLAGGSAASSVLRDLEGLQTLAPGMGSFTDDIQWLEDFLGISAEQAKKLADEAERQAQSDADTATRDAKTAADKAIRDAKDQASREAREAEEIFNRQFIDPIAKALRTGDWLGAAETINVMAANLPTLIADAEAMALKHGLDIENLDVLDKLVGMEGMLITALEARIAIAEAAGDFDIVTELKRQLGLIVPEDVPEVEAPAFGEEYGALFDTVLGFLPKMVTDLKDFVATLRGLKDAETDEEKMKATGDAVAAGLQLLASIIEAWISRLEEQKAELEEQVEFYISAYESMAGVLSNAVGGGLLGGAIDLFAASVRMAVSDLQGIDLLNASLSSLTNFANVLINSFRNLISASDASAMIQKESQTIWKAIGNLLGEFLWPVAAALRMVRQMLGIPSDTESGAAATSSQIGIPAGFKTERLRYQAIAPGDKVLDSEEDEVQIPAWAEPVGEALANAIMEVLANFGISSWTQLMEGARTVAQNVWAWISTRLPAMVTSAIEGIENVRQVLIDAGWTWDNIASRIGELADLAIAEFPEFAENAANFFVSVAAAAGRMLELLEDAPTMKDLAGKWDETNEALANLDSLPNIVKAIDKVEAQIGFMKKVLAYTIAVAAGAIVGAVAGANLIRWGAAALGALAGGATAFLFDILSPEFHDGGIVQGPPGVEQTIKAMPGETILPTHKSGGGSFMRPIVIPIMLDGRKVGEGMVKWATNEGWELTGHSSSGPAWTGRGT